MGNLRELDYRLAGLLGWRHVEREVWIPPNGVVPKPVPHWSRDPAACADLDGEMRLKGYRLLLINEFDHSAALYYRLNDPILEECYGSLVSALVKFGSNAPTEWEARTRAAIAALEKAEGDGNQ
jgi:hypothetical protein